MRAPRLAVLPRLVVITLGCLAGAVVAGCDSETDQAAAIKAKATTTTTTKPSEPVTIESVARDYASLIAITPEPVEVDMALAMRCRGVSEADVKRSKQESGPHAWASVKIYMNAAARDAFEAGTSYPVGAVVVKEKGTHPYQLDDGSNANPPDGVGGMIKRAAGYDAEHGDWDYFYFDTPLKDASSIESGTIASCVNCHRGAADRDYVFGNWRSPAK